MYKTLTINGAEYEFNFGFGFVKAISRVKLKDGEEIGLRYRVAQLYDGNPEALVDVLMKARVKTNAPTMEELQEWLEDENTDIDAVFDQVLDFLSTANCSKKQTLDMLASVKEEGEIQKAETAKRRKEAGLD